MQWQDLTNSIFEFSGVFFIWFSIRKVLQDKKVAGVSYLHVGFFTAWGFWNLYYYPHLNQWMSFIGGLAITVANGIYTYLIIYYTLKQKKIDKYDF